MMTKAYSTFSVKSIDSQSRVLRGVASTPAPDRSGDQIDPFGADYQLPVPLLWQHRQDKPIGWVTEAKVNKSGIAVTAEVMTESEPGALKDRLDEAWQSIKSGLVRGFSVGFKIRDYDLTAENAMIIKKWDWLELSAVTIPANTQASISAVKAFATEGASAPQGVVQVSPQNLRRASCDSSIYYLRDK